MGGKTRKIYSTRSSCLKQVARFCCPFYRSSSNWYRTRYHACCRSLFIHLPQYSLFTPENFAKSFVLNCSLAFQSSKEKLKTMLLRNLGGKQGVLWEICTWRMEAITLEWLFLSLSKTLSGDLVFSKKQKFKLSQIIVSNFVSVMIRASINKSQSRFTVIPFSFHNLYDYREN